MRTNLDGLTVEIHGGRMESAQPYFDSVTLGNTLTLTPSELYELGAQGMEIDAFARVEVASDALERGATLRSLKEWRAIA